MPTVKGWEEFRDSPYWKELAETIRARILITQQDLLNPEKCSTIEELRALQREAETCFWLLNLPGGIIGELKGEVKDEKPE